MRLPQKMKNFLRNDIKRYNGKRDPCGNAKKYKK